MVDFSQYMPVIGRANAVGDNLTGYNTPERITQRQMMAVQQQEQQRKMVENQEMLRKLEISKQVWQQSGGDLNRYHQLMSAYAPENAMAAQEFTRKQEELNAPTITIQDGNVIKRSRSGEVSAMPIPGYQQKQDKPTFSADLGGYIYPPDAQNPQGRLVRIPGASKPKEPKAPEFNKDMGGYVYPPDAQNPQGRFVPLQGAPEIGGIPRPRRNAAQEDKFRNQISDDFKNVGQTKQNTENISADIENILKSPGLGARSGYTGYMPAWLQGGEAKTTQNRIETLKGKVTQMGKQIASASGSLGSMAIAEWKIVADAVNAIDPTADNFEEQLANIEQQAMGTAKRMEDAYTRQYEPDLPVYKQFAPENIKVDKAFRAYGQDAASGNVSPAMNNMPPANSASGRVVRDTSTGIRYKSDGSRWVRVE